MNDQPGRSRIQSHTAIRPQDVPRHAGRVVRRMLLRRGINVGADTAQVVADAVLALSRDCLREGDGEGPASVGAAAVTLRIWRAPGIAPVFAGQLREAQAFVMRHPCPGGE